MKKPLILLVDDDQAVLQALEAVLRPEFEEICRIEAFDDPTEVIETVTRWEKERRAIAVAIVDQKMPGLSGVELLVRLRGWMRRRSEEADGDAFDPIAYLRAIVLTGYAGLDSALAAKNDVGIDRYLEKPWSRDNLVEETRGALARSFADSSALTWYEFREVRDIVEIEELLRTRFRVYRESPELVGSLLPDYGSNIDLEPYDAVARLFGLFQGSTDGPVLVGTLRLASDALGPGPHVRDLETIAAQWPGLSSNLHGPRPEPLPSMVWLVDREAVRRLHDSSTRRGERVVEPGRLTLVTSFRRSSQSAGTVGNLAGFILEGTTAFFFDLDIEHAILTCIPWHRRLYERLGFQEVEGTRTSFQPALGAEKTCLHSTRASVPALIRPSILSLATRISRTRAACRCATYPACLPGPYETGDFRDADALCPLRASEVLAVTCEK